MAPIDFEKILPHRDRMKLIDEIIDVNNNMAVTNLNVKDNWPLVTDNEVSPIIIIEIIAQTSGIAVGNKKLKETGKGAFGYLVGIKKAEFPNGNIPLGTKLECRADLVHDLETYAVFKGIVKSETKIYGSAEIQLFSPEE